MESSMPGQEPVSQEVSQQPSQPQLADNLNVTPASGFVFIPKVIGFLVAALVIVGVGAYFAFFSKGPVGGLGDDDSSLKVQQQTGSGTQVTDQDTGSSKAFKTCDALIDIDQVKNIVGIFNLEVTSSMGDHTNTSGDFSLGCIYRMNIVPELFDESKPSGTVMVSYYPYIEYQAKLHDDFALIKSQLKDPVSVSGLGSEAYRGYSVSQPSTYFIGSDKHSIVGVSVIYQHDFKPTTKPDIDKEFQMGLDIAKIVDNNLERNK